MGLDTKGIMKETCYWYLNKNLVTKKEKRELGIDCHECDGKNYDCLKYQELGKRGLYEYLEK